jgi:hypothetical protein
MSKGSPIVPLRIPAALLAKIDADIARSIHFDDTPRDNRTVWILAAILDVFRHRERARQCRRKRRSDRWDEYEKLERLAIRVLDEAIGQ